MLATQNISSLSRLVVTIVEHNFGSVAYYDNIPTSDAIDSNDSTNIASSKAVSILNAKFTGITQTLTNNHNTHKNNYSNPHKVTKSQVGLSDIPNAISGSVTIDSNESLATSKAVKVCYDFSATIQSSLNQHTRNKANPHQVDKADVGLSNIPNAISDNYNYNRHDCLATSRGLYNLYNNVLPRNVLAIPNSGNDRHLLYCKHQDNKYIYSTSGSPTIDTSGRLNCSNGIYISGYLVSVI